MVDREKDNSNETKKVENFDPGNDGLYAFFEDFIKKGVLSKEEEIVPGFIVKLQTLNTGELLTAESIMRLTQEMPFDIVQKVRGASILSQSILKINQMDVVKDDDSQEEKSRKRTELYRYLLKMPAYVVQKTFDLYISAVTEQNKIYESPEETTEKIKNF